MIKLPRDNYGLTRWDQEKKNNHGWGVRLGSTKSGERVVKFFADKKHGGDKKAYRAAKAFRDSQLLKMPILQKRLANWRTRPTSDVVGVVCDIRKREGADDYLFWTVNSTPKKISFSEATYGAKAAKKKAEEVGVLAREGKMKDAQALADKFRQELRHFRALRREEKALEAAGVKAAKKAAKKAATTAKKKRGETLRSMLRELNSSRDVD